MNKALKTIFLILLALFNIPFNGYSFINKDIHLLTMQDGLSDNHVLSIFKDSEGFMWFGTNNGLNRYDGSIIDNFALDLSTNMIVSQVENLSEQCLGLIINGTLYGFNRQTEEFIPISIDKKQIELNQFKCDGNGVLYTINHNQLSIYKIIEERIDSKAIGYNIECIQTQDIYNEKYSIIKFNFSETKNELLFISNDFELVIFNIETKNIDRRVLLNRANKQYNINAIMDFADIIWISTVADGIITYDRKTHLTNDITYNDDDRKSKLSHTDLYILNPLDNGNILAITCNGYTILKPQQEDYSNLKAEIHNNTSFTNRNFVTRMICSYYDSQNIIWIGTAGGGVIYSDLQQTYYNQYHQNRHNEICSIISDEDGYIWLSTFHKGIMRSEKPFNAIETPSFKSVKYKLHSDKETFLCSDKDNNGNLWFGNRNGDIVQYNKEMGFKTHKLIVDTLTNQSAIWSIKIDSKNNFWIGTENGLLSYIPELNKCIKVELDITSIKGSELIINAIEETKDGKLWVGTYLNGVRQLENGRLKSKQYGESMNLQNSTVRSLLAASDGNLYIGFTTGFGVLNSENEVLTDFLTTANGLCSNNIGCLVEDDKGQIWLGNNSGISDRKSVV